VKLPAKAEGSVEIFCSYSHKDDKFCEAFIDLLKPMKRRKLIQVWHDRKIPPGSDWARDIDAHLNRADIITLLVSSDFLASGYCYENEGKRALERQELKEALVVPIIIRPCDWADEPFARLQAMPTDGKAVTAWDNQDLAWTDVARNLKLRVKEVLQQKLDKIKAERDLEPPKLKLGTLGAEPPETSGSDSRQAQLIYSQLVKDAEKRRSARGSKLDERRAHLIADLDKRIFQIDQDVGIAPLGHRTSQKQAKDAFADMDKYTRAL
jgi:TIR domain